MSNITATAVKALRDRTGLPMMECKRALQDAQGNEEVAIENLRKAGKKTMDARAGRETSSGRIAVFTSIEPGIGAMVELQCESAPVAGSDEFVGLGNDLAKQAALGAGATSAEELLSQPSPSKEGLTLQEQMDDLCNRIREVFKIARIVRFDGPCGGYGHHTGTDGVVLQISDKCDPDLAKDICMHIAAMRPQVLAIEDLDPAEVQKEREILTEAARGEGKPENIIEKMVEGRMKNFYSQQVLLEQPFVKDDSKTVGQVVKEAGMKLVKFLHWKLGK